MFGKAIITIFVVCAMAVTSSATMEADCPQICPALYAPICATDGKIFKEFSNTCELKSSNCRLKKSLLKPYVATAMDWCSTDLVENVDDLLVKLNNLDITTPKCLKPCAMIYQPVCISNGKYRVVASNKCLMENINCALGNENAFKVLQDGTC
ncbi:kazal-type protease inhibitor m1 [Haematobia irritans]|uniref:kazal-type protease inhibitor m1 n=1 Tax=Haematobia irritans TaxID=7368 RepID=UPI003F4FEA26